jgi:hypothetical protein
MPGWREGGSFLRLLALQQFSGQGHQFGLFGIKFRFCGYIGSRFGGQGDDFMLQSPHLCLQFFDASSLVELLAAEEAAAPLVLSAFPEAAASLLRLPDSADSVSVAARAERLCLGGNFHRVASGKLQWFASVFLGRFLGAGDEHHRLGGGATADWPEQERALFLELFQ